ncbi:MAG: WG repeat-containing protein [Clostridia bacterium]|nr:WG repeat-containing protein [Clostridia bacterium]
MSENIIQYVEAARSGDTDAMAKLYSKTLKAAYFLADTLSAGDGSAIDITKKAYAKAFCSVDKLKRPEAFEIWMKQNVAAVFKEGKKFVFADAEAGAAENSSEFLSEEIFEDEEKSAAVIKTVSGLKTELRAAVVLHYNNGMPVAALAKFLGVSESTANALLGKARSEIVSAAGVEACGEASGSLPVLTKIFQRAASAAVIDNADVRDIFIYAIDAYEASRPAEPAAPAVEEIPVKEETEQSAEPAAEEKAESEESIAAPADNVISFKQKINDILDKENISAAEEEPETQPDEAEESENLDIPAFVSTEPSEEAERAVEQFSEYEKREKPVSNGKKKINLNKKTIGIACACLIALVVICVGISKIAGNKPDVPSNGGTTDAVDAIAAGYEWKAGGFAECNEIEYLDDNCAKFKSASTGKYGLLDYQGNIVLQPYYDGFTRCSYGRDYSGRNSYHSLVQINSDFFEFTFENGTVTVSDTPHTAHAPEADSFGDPSYDERDRYFEGYAAARKDGLWGYVSQEKDKKVIPYEYEAVNDLQASAAAASDYCRPVTGGLIAVKKDGMMGIIDLENEIVVPFEYTSIMPGSDGVFIACKGGTWGVILVGNAVSTFKGINISVDPDATVPSTSETTSSQANNIGSYTVISETGANVRDDAGAEFNKIGELDYGDTVVGYDTKTAKDTGKKWIKIKYNGKYGWVAMSNLEE